MIVYRLQTIDGKGAVEGGLFSCYDRGLYHRDYKMYPDNPAYLDKSAYNHKGPTDESPHFLKRFQNLQKRWGRSEVIFGCASLDQMFDIIPSVRGRRAIADYGGMIFAYKTDGRTVAIGDDQVVFVRSRSTLLNQIGLDELDNHG